MNEAVGRNGILQVADVRSATDDRVDVYRVACVVVQRDAHQLVGAQGLDDVAHHLPQQRAQSVGVAFALGTSLPAGGWLIDLYSKRKNHRDIINKR
jgi:hypothetical protein